MNVPAKNVLFVRPFNGSAQTMRKLFSQFGRVKRAVVFKGKSCGIVKFWCVQDASVAMHKLTGHEFEGRKLIVTYSDRSFVELATYRIVRPLEEKPLRVEPGNRFVYGHKRGDFAE